MNLAELDRLIAEAPRAELPSLLGSFTELEAKVRLRLAEAQAVALPSSRVIDADEAASIAGCSKRWVLSHTSGLKFRCDLTRKQPRFAEDGLRAWLATRRRS